MTDIPKIHLIGNAHIDPVWLWRWQEGYAEIKATFQSALDRMEEFPEFIFTCGCAAYYGWVEENAPEMFAEIRRRVSEGRWVIVGGQWVQPDCNTPSGESFARHGLYSQRYFKEKFGITAAVGYNVDSFGHNAMMPQILKSCGIDAYVFMRPDKNENPALPGDLFRWLAPDGSYVTAFRIPFSYGQWYADDDGNSPAELQKINATLKLADERQVDYMGFYGVGNHGGGPTINNLNMIRKIQNEPDSIVSLRETRLRRPAFLPVHGGQFVHSSPNAYFDSVSDITLPEYSGDLQHHARGCYSAHSETKILNRKAEHRLAAAEKFSSLAEILLGLPYPGERLAKAWKNILFNQFHDIMGGCAVKEAYDDSRESYGEALNIGAVALNAALQKISWAVDTSYGAPVLRSKEKDWKVWENGDGGVPVVIFNPLSWDVTVPVQINHHCAGAVDDLNGPVPVQKVRASYTNGPVDRWNTLLIASLPAMGYRVYRLFRDKPMPVEASDTPVAEPHALENKYLRLKIDPSTGHIAKLYDKENQTEVFKAPAAVPVVIDETAYDTWAHNIAAFRDELGVFSGARVQVVEQGPLRARLRVTNYYGNSSLRQDFMLYGGRREIEVRVKLDWREEHRMLKLSFPVNAREPKAVYDIPFGFIERPADGGEEHGQQWVDVTGGIDNGGSYGLTLLNDGKYGFDVLDGDLRMTSVRGAGFADHYGERDDLCECMDQGIQEFRYALVPHSGDWRQCNAARKANELNVPPIPVIETFHRGPLPLAYSGIQIKGDGVIVTAFKKAEDGNGYILRFYESKGREVPAAIYVPALNRRFSIDFKPCQIKTFLIPADPDAAVEETNFLEL